MRAHPCKATANASIGAQGDYDEANSLFRRAAAEASQALPAGGGSSPGARLEPSPWALREAAASAISGLGQVGLARRQWDAAEEPLSEVRDHAVRCCRHCLCTFTVVFLHVLARPLQARSSGKLLRSSRRDTTVSWRPCHHSGKLYQLLMYMPFADFAA